MGCVYFLEKSRDMDVSAFGSVVGPRARPRVSQEELAAAEAGARANPWTPTSNRPKVFRGIVDKMSTPPGYLSIAQPDYSHMMNQVPRRRPGPQTQPQSQYEMRPLQQSSQMPRAQRQGPPAQKRGPPAPFIEQQSVTPRRRVEFGTNNVQAYNRNSAPSDVLPSVSSSTASEAQQAFIADNYGGKPVPILYDPTTGLLTLEKGLGLDEAPQATDITELDNLLLKSAEERVQLQKRQESALKRNENSRVKALANAQKIKTNQTAAREAAAKAAAAAAKAATNAASAAKQAEKNARAAEVTAKQKKEFIEKRTRLLALSDENLLYAIRGLTTYALRLTEGTNSRLLRNVVLNDSTTAITIFRKSGILRSILTTAKDSNQRQLLIEACKKHSALLPSLKEANLVSSTATCDSLNTIVVRRGGTRAKKQKRNCTTKRRHH